jgi:hypothetical protein
MIVPIADIVMVGMAIEKDGVAFARPAITRDRAGTKKDVDARDKRGRDVERFARCC